MKTTAHAAAVAASYAYDAANKAYTDAYNFGTPIQLDDAAEALYVAERAFWRAVEARDAAAETV
jgi:hypothetical protein